MFAQLRTFTVNLLGLPARGVRPEWRLGNSKDLALLVFAGIFLSGIVAAPVALISSLVWDVDPTCQRQFQFNLPKAFGVLIFAPVIESFLLGGLVLLIASVGAWTAVFTAAAIAALVHVYINGPLAVVVFIPFVVFARVYQVGQSVSDFGIGVRRATVCHMAYNVPLFVAASYCIG